VWVLHETGHLRIGELSRRVGVSPELLRAWERRYHLLQPVRSPGGFRLYSEADELRVRRMQGYLERGLSAAEAARIALNGSEAAEAPGTPSLAEYADRLREALERYDEPSANAIVDRLLATISTEAVLTEIILPMLRSLGDRWQAGEIKIAQEHFASNVLRGRLMGLARGWGNGSGSTALLACPAGELHDLPLVIFGISLHGLGWRIAFLGADTPIATIEQAAATLAPSAVVLTAVTPVRLRSIERELAMLAARTTVAICGSGAEPELARRVGALYLDGDPVSAAVRLARGVVR
jgi:DNA-binding transcriptional MerR regulator